MPGWLKTWLGGGELHSPPPRAARLRLEPLESREVPAVINYVVNTEYDTPDANPNDNIPLDAMGRVSLRSVMEHVEDLVNPNPDGYLIEFANVKGQSYLCNMGGEPAVVAPNPSTVMTIPLTSQLPSVQANSLYYIYGSTTRRVTITRADTVPEVNAFRFLDIELDGKVEVNGLRFTDALNFNEDGGAINNDLGGTLSVINCEFRNNVAAQGGAIANAGTLLVGTGDPHTPPDQRSVFIQNRAMQSGGAIITGDAGGFGRTSTATIANALFENNRAYNIGTEEYGFGGAITHTAGGTVSITFATLVGNRAKQRGPSLWTSGYRRLQPSRPATAT